MEEKDQGEKIQTGEREREREKTEAGNEMER